MHLHNALLCGQGARPPCQAATGYKLSQNLSNFTEILQNLLHGKTILQILPNGTKILQDFPKGRKVLGVSHSLPKLKNLAVLQGQTFLDGKSASEHTFSGVGCNVRVFQGIFQGQRKSRVFQGLPGFVDHPVYD